MAWLWAVALHGWIYSKLQYGQWHIPSAILRCQLVRPCMTLDLETGPAHCGHCHHCLDQNKNTNAPPNCMPSGPCSLPNPKTGQGHNTTTPATLTSEFYTRKANLADSLTSPNKQH
eukprot:1134390-Pelagomonas_calceolata.AAC.2